MNELNELLAELGWSQRKLSRVVKVEPNTTNRWAQGLTETPYSVILLLRILAHTKKVVE